MCRWIAFNDTQTGEADGVGCWFPRTQMSRCVCLDASATPIRAVEGRKHTHTEILTSHAGECESVSPLPSLLLMDDVICVLYSCSCPPPGPRRRDTLCTANTHGHTHLSLLGGCRLGGQGWEHLAAKWGGCCPWPPRCEQGETA